VARVFIAAGEETGAMAVALDARLREPCARLSTDDAGVKAGAGSVSMALAAAMER